MYILPRGTVNFTFSWKTNTKTINMANVPCLRMHCEDSLLSIVKLTKLFLSNISINNTIHKTYVPFAKPNHWTHLFTVLSNSITIIHISSQGRILHKMDILQTSITIYYFSQNYHKNHGSTRNFTGFL